MSVPDVSPEEYEEGVHALVVENAPRRFAIVQEYWVGGQRDAHVAAWGLRFDDEQVRIHGEEREAYKVFPTAETAATFVSRVTEDSTRVVWVDSAAR
ncbi:hypothetical protein H7827_09175 [Streptomyces sp. JH002]|uniref:hypothetical protein n=1 Tax=Streptomyces TaxID=1883 RepID=UPI001F2A52E8|nr:MULTISPECIES: hypothetical protein [unclassified Streptomyces]MCU4746834.1 hypothetical protein [Streptomyces sp. G-5]